MKKNPATSEAPSTALPAYAEARGGAIYATLAFVTWAALPVYFKAVAEVSPWEVLAHRVFWSMVFVALLLLLWRKRRGLRAALHDRSVLGWLTVSALLVSSNWLIFIWAIANEHVLESSLGYFINPLLNVVLGVLVLRERLRRAQWIAISLGALGVANLVWQHGQLPWIALSLAITFGLYGLIRKRTPVDALTGLFIETTLIAPIALAYLIYLAVNDSGAFGAVHWRLDLLLMSAGILTASPLILFAAAARRLTLSTLGQLQYTVPTGHFLLAVFAFGEPFTRAHAVTFALIWAALLIYALDTYRGERRRAAAKD